MKDNQCVLFLIENANRTKLYKCETPIKYKWRKKIETAISICKLGGQAQVIQTNIREEWDG